MGPRTSAMASSATIATPLVVRQRARRRVATTREPVHGSPELLVGAGEHLGRPDAGRGPGGRGTPRRPRHAVATPSILRHRGVWRQCQIPHRSCHGLGSRRWPSVASPPALRARCTSATCAPRCWPGCSPAHAGSRFLLRIEDLDPATSRRRARGAAARRPRRAGPRLGRAGGAPVRAPRRARGGAGRPRRAAASPTRASAAAARSARRAWRPTCCRARTRGPAATSRADEVAAQVAAGRPAALRLRADGEPVTIVDRLRGEVTRPADDIVLRRNDGVPGVPRGRRGRRRRPGGRGGGARRRPARRHAEPGPPARPARPAPTRRGRTCPLVLGADGDRLAKRHGAVTLADLRGDPRRPRRGAQPPRRQPRPHPGPASR